MADHTAAAPSPFESAMRQARQADEANDSHAAVAALQEALRLEPGSAQAQFLLGAQYAQLGQLDEAEHAFAFVVVQEPSLHTARFQLGLLQLTRGKPAQAAATWQGLDILPEANPLRIFAHGLICLAGDQFEAARDALRHGMEVNLNNPALNRDMQNVLDHIAMLLADAAPDEENHFLLSTYQQQNLH